jgi:aspartyl-tRNA(Asn)/glutamyl-tRNA(Gln) amidotransferase subunit B
MAANWIQNDVARLRGDADGHTLDPHHLADLLRMVDQGEIGNSAARQVLPAVYESGRPPREVVAEMGLGLVSDTAELEAIVRQVLEDNPEPVADYRSGKLAAINRLKGKAMQASGGKANHAVVEDLLKNLLNS